jgi:hypothetical protein
MSRRLVHSRRKSRQKPKRRYLNLVVIFLVAGLSFGAALGAWKSGKFKRALHTTQPIPAPPLSLPSPGHPSKEYIYAGNKLLATEQLKSDQLISFDAIPSKTYGDSPFALVANSSSQLPVAFTVVSGPATVSGSTLTITGAGDVTVRGDQAGNDGFNPAESVSQSFNVSKATATISLSNLSQTYDGSSKTVGATTDPSGLAGLSISYNGSNDNPTNAGSYDVVAVLTNDNYQAANANGTLVIGKANQVITFDPISNVTYGSSPFNVSATCSSGMAVSYSITSGPATISGAVVTISGVGNVTVRATQSGDANYNAASNVDRSFTITKASSSVSVNCPASQTYSASAIEPCTAAYSGAGGLNGSVAPTYISNINVGTATASASYGGDANHEGSSGSANFNITKASSTTTVTCTDIHAYTGSAITPCWVAVGGNDFDLTPTPRPTPVYANNINAGSNTASASYTFAGDANHTGSSDSKTFSIAQAGATISINGYTGIYDGNSHGATGSVTGVNGEALTNFLNLGAAFTNVPGGTAHWTFAGDTNYIAASGDVTITITKATPMISWNDPANILAGTALSATQLNATASVAGTFVYTPAAGTILSPGNNRPLSVAFTPTDTANYDTPPNKTVAINVIACPTVSGSSFSVNHALIATGTGVLLSWNVPNATSVTISGVTGTFSSSGTAAVAPTATTTYTLTANGAGPCSSINLNTTVTVASCPTATASSLSASATSIVAGDSVTLNWNAPNGTRVVIRRSGDCENPQNCNGVMIDGSSANGSITFAPQSSQTYTMEASGAYGCQTIEKQVVIQVAPLVGCSSQAYFVWYDMFDESTCASQGAEPALSWYIPGANGVGITDDRGNDYGYFFTPTCYACGPGGAASGSIDVNPITDTTYTLRADTGGAYVCTLTVVVHVCP